jgi:AraC-like DNA-binding protein
MRAKQPLIHASVLDAVRPLVAKHGIDFETLLAEAGIPNTPRRDESAFLPLDPVCRLLEDLARRLDDPAFGLHCAEAYPVRASGVFGYILLNAGVVRDAIEVIGRYNRLVLWPIEFEHTETEEGAELSWRYPASLVAPRVQFNCAIAAVFVLRLRLILGQDWAPQLVELDHREPGASPEFARIFGRNVRFNGDSNRIVVLAHDLSKRPPDADPMLYRILRQHGDTLLAARENHRDLPTQIRAEIGQRLGVTAPTLEAVAAALRLSPRTIQRRLRQLGTSFEKQVTETRQANAERLLRDTDLPLTEIAFLLGFSELSAFTRAAHRWFGVSPSVFRARLREGNPPG